MSKYFHIMLGASYVTKLFSFNARKKRMLHYTDYGYNIGFRLVRLAYGNSKSKG